ncbi:hypothetical protein SNE40_014985 [Patella caerulea]|uniref:DUF4550 domain-containing protein n=1 Tax=Patella caerulea TaxID=87958 RepID=A0AAN8PIB2_PATCE
MNQPESTSSMEHPISNEDTINSEFKISNDSESSEKIEQAQATPSDSQKADDKRPESVKTQESGISGRPKSTSSGDLMFEAKRKKKKAPTDPDAYDVTFVVTIAMAIPSAEEELSQEVRDLMKKRRRVFEAPRAQSYYHLEYYLVPDEEELMKTDCVTYGVAAKLYMERQDPRVIKTWQEGMITWVAWANSHTITMTKELLLKLFTHTLELRVWDTKDKVSARARFDRPKAFRLPQPKPGEDADDVGGVKPTVMKQCRSYTRLQPKKGPAIRPLPTTVTYAKSETSIKRRYLNEGAVSTVPDDEMQEDFDQTDRPSPENSIAMQSDKLPSPQSLIPTPQDSERVSPTPHCLVAVPTDTQPQDGRTFSRLGHLAGAMTNLSTTGREQRSQKSSQHQLSVNVKARTPSQTSNISRGRGERSSSNATRRALPSRASDGSALHPAQLDSPSKHKRSKKAEAAAQMAAEEIKKSGICNVPIQMSLLFSDMKSVTSRLKHPVAGVEDMFITVALDGPLMSEKIKHELNPMIIKIHSASDMPNTPMSFSEMRSKCHPVYCKYKFYKQPEHISAGKEHGDNIYWDDTNVVLLGHMEKSELREYLNGPALEIEIHDRDRKCEEVKLKPTLFGDDLEDEKISNVGTVTSRRTVHNPFHGRNKPWDPYGVSKINLSELLLGHRYLHLKIPIHNCPLPDVLGLESSKNGRIMGVAGAVDGPVEKPLPAGHYLKHNTMLKVKIELAVPLVTPDKIQAKEDLATTFECPFGRLVYVFSYHNTVMLNNLQQLITDLNAEALDLKDMPQHVMNAALSTYKLSIQQQESRDLDIITGFQVMDGKHHIFVIEGLRDKALKLLWNSLPKEENSDTKVLYNSDMSFSQRLYRALDVDLCRIKLHEPLSVIVQQSLLYVRDMVPKLCFQSLVKLHQLSTIDKLRDAVRNDLFPTSEMVISMSREFGVPFTAEDFDELRPEFELKKSPPPMIKEPSRLGTTRNWTPIDNVNKGYEAMLAEKEGRQQTIDFIQDNKAAVENQSYLNRRLRERTQVLTMRADVHTAHNYSTQTLNSTDLGKEKLRKALSANPDKRYTYCQDYHHSMTVVPVNVDELKKASVQESKERWLTQSGWIQPGMKTMLESNAHPNDIGEARKESLCQPWRENILHVNHLQSTLGRDRYPWDYRRYDIDLYRRPQPYFDPNQPTTIHLAGEKLRQEKLQVQQKEQETWKSKIVVADTRSYYHRCLPETELCKSGFKSSNQLERLTGLLKNKPEKYALKQPGFAAKIIPPLNVVLNPRVDTAARLEGRILESANPDEYKDYNKGFKPGPIDEQRLIFDKNVIPADDYKHSKFIQLKGQDFNVYHTERQILWQRHIQALNDSERDNHLFRIPYDPAIHGPLDVPIEFQLGQRSQTEPDVVNRSGILKPMTINSEQFSVSQKTMEPVS